MTHTLFFLLNKFFSYLLPSPFFNVSMNFLLRKSHFYIYLKSKQVQINQNKSHFMPRHLCIFFKKRICIVFFLIIIDSYMMWFDVMCDVACCVCLCIYGNKEGKWLLLLLLLCFIFNCFLLKTKERVDDNFS